MWNVWVGYLEEIDANRTRVFLKSFKPLEELSN